MIADVGNIMIPCRCATGYHPNRQSVASAKPAEHEGNMHSKETLVQKVFVLGYFVEIVSKKKKKQNVTALSLYFRSDQHTARLSVNCVTNILIYV